jgi:general L-amino acid transport system substrate-binding protein
MSRNPMRALLAIVFVSVVFRAVAAPSAAAEDVLARVRMHGTLHCAGIVRPGVAVPSADGAHWYGLAADMCRAVAAAVLGDPARMTFRPYFDGERARSPADVADDIVFLSGAQLVGTAATNATALQLGPAIVHDALALLAPAGGVSHVAELATKSVCVEPGSSADRALQRYFETHALALHEHPFQETDEMRQAYGDGKCDALAGPLSTLASVRADPAEGRPADRVLPELLADDPIVAASGGDARWSRIVWWTFSVLVDAEDAGISGRAAATSTQIPGVPPAIATELGLSAGWARDALTAGGNYGELFEHDLGASSKFGLARGANALWRNGGLIFGLSVE